MDIKKIVDYWAKGSARDLEVAKSLLKMKHYLYCLFFTQLVIEKVLKALVVQMTAKHAPRSHNLVELAKLAGLNFTAEEIDFLDRLTDFNLEARYPDFKLSAYKKATPILTKKYFQRANELRLCLINELSKISKEK